MKTLFALAASLLVTAACQRTAEPVATAPVSSDPVAVPASLTLDGDGIGICPRQYTCDGSTYYSTKTACQTACGTSCFLDYNCNGRCICP